MAFDLSTAKVYDPASAPAPASSGFDITSAKVYAPPAAEDKTHDTTDYEPPKDESKMGRLARLAKKTWQDSENKVQRAYTGGGVHDELGTELGKGALETGLQMATGAVGSVAGGLAGLGTTLVKGPAAGGETARKVQSALTYEPRTNAGKLISELAASPMELAGEALGYTGGKTGKYAGRVADRVIGNKNTELERHGEALGSTAGENAIPLLAAAYGGESALEQTRAPKVREPIPGKDFSPLRDLTPEQEARYRQQQKLGVEPTLGSVTRTPEQFRFEEQTAKTDAGAALRQREIENNAALTKAVEKTDTMRAGKRLTENEREVGQTVARALEAKAKDSLSNVSDLYKAAEASGETKLPVNTRPLRRWLKDNEAEAVAVPEINSISSKLAALKRAGKGVVTVDDLENLYKVAGQLGEPGKSSGVFMRNVKDVINKITDGAGGDLYREARAARLRHAFEFEDRGAIANLIEKKTGSRTDYKTANEDVFRKAVVGSSLTELQDVTNSLLSADPVKNPAARQAVRELQAQTIDHLMDAATKGIGKDEMGNAAFSPAGFRKEVRNIGRDKLEHLLGPDALQRLQDIVEASRDVKTVPGRVSGSDTRVNFATEAARLAKQEAAHHLLSGVPVVGRVASGLQKWRQAGKDAEALRSQVDEALTPTRAAPATTAELAMKAKKLNKQYSMKEAGELNKALAPLVYTGAEQAEEATR